MLRRVLLVVLPAAALASPQAAAQPKLGDSEWLRLFGALLRELNQFVFSINDDRLDRARWQRVRSAWADLEGKRRGREIDSIE